MVFWYNYSMNKPQITRREQVVAGAIGSVRAEGLNPSEKTQKRLHDYATGKITATDLRASTLQELRAKTSR